MDGKMDGNMQELDPKVLENVTGGAEEDGEQYYIINGHKIYANSFAEALKYAREHGLL